MKKMLIVEDDILSQNVLRRIFKNDFEVNFCESAEEYYEKFSLTNYEIVIMDIAIKGSKNGLELIKEMKTDPSHAVTPVLCLTAHAQAKMERNAIESGADLFITKPVTTQRLRESVYSLIK